MQGGHYDRMPTRDYLLGYSLRGHIRPSFRGGNTMSRQPIIVSVQRSTAADAIAGHLGWGALIDTEHVLVPEPFDWIQEPDTRVEVLLSPLSSAASLWVERIQITQVDIHPAITIGSSPFVALQLAHPFRRESLELFEGTVLTEALSNREDTWKALETMGVTPPGLPDCEPKDLLEPIVVLEQELLRNLVNDQRRSGTRYITAGILSKTICRIFHCKR